MEERKATTSSSSTKDETKSTRRQTDDFVKIRDVPGLSFSRCFVTQQEQYELLDFAKKAFGCDHDEGGSKDLLQYGYEYHIASKSSPPTATTPIPSIVQPLIARFLERGFFSQAEPPNQLIWRKYRPGAGIAHHVDHVNHFGGTVAGVSLLSSTTLEWLPATDETQCGKSEIKSVKVKAIETRLPAKSAYVMQDDARYGFTHGIRARKSDKIGTVAHARGVRYSLTLRRVLDKKAA
jgi:alkylated DNA repair dioxygenase AlkB